MKLLHLVTPPPEKPYQNTLVTDRLAAADSGCSSPTTTNHDADLHLDLDQTSEHRQPHQATSAAGQRIRSSDRCTTLILQDPLPSPISAHLYGTAISFNRESFPFKIIFRAGGPSLRETTHPATPVICRLGQRPWLAAFAEHLLWGLEIFSAYSLRTHRAGPACNS
ncbi:hypothetical protein ACLB2K_056460 [Fragaria x ananassa]